MKSGKLIVFEGPDGVGKTTIANNIVKNLNKQGLDAIYASFPGKESKTLGKLVYEIHHFPESCKVSSITEESKQILHIAAQFDTIANQIKPALEQGKYVILDRYWWSTIVYGVTAGVSYDLIWSLVDILLRYWGEVITPDLVILFKGSSPFTEEDMSRWKRLNNAYENIYIKFTGDTRFGESCFLQYPLTNTKSIENITNDIFNIIHYYTTYFQGPKNNTQE